MNHACFYTVDLDQPNTTNSSSMAEGCMEGVVDSAFIALLPAQAWLAHLVSGVPGIYAFVMCDLCHTRAPPPCHIPTFPKQHREDKNISDDKKLCRKSRATIRFIGIAIQIRLRPPCGECRLDSQQDHLDKSVDDR